MGHRSRLVRNHGRNVEVLTLLVSVIYGPSTLGKNPKFLESWPGRRRACMVSRFNAHASSRTPARSVAPGVTSDLWHLPIADHCGQR